MITLNGMDYSTNTALFSASKAADLANLPTTTDPGTVDNSIFPAVKAGSIAYLTDGSGKKYVLDGDTDSWKETA